MNNNMEEDPIDYDQQNLSDDDNAQPEDEEPVAVAGEGEDPLLLAVDDLEGRVVSSLDDVKVHPGVRTFAIATTDGGTGGGGGGVHDELATLLRPVLEVAAHTGPSVARTYFRGATDSGGLDEAVEEVYERLVSDLVLPVLLEMAQSDQIPAKRGAALEFFRLLWKETHKAGSWLDTTTPNSSLAGPYGSGGGSGGSGSHGTAHGGPLALPRPLQNRRKEKRLAREGEILRYWIQAAIACLTPGVFTAEQADLTAASRGILAASASLRPALRHIVQRIKAADDRGANRLYTPVMKMIENILNRLFLSNQPAEAMIASCIKFLEIVVLCCSRKPKESSRRRGGAVTASSSSSSEDFSLEDLPEGHPIITRETLESIADFAFTTMRGLTLMGGQVKIDVNVLSGMMLTGGSPSEQVISILKPAALAYLEIESTLPSPQEDGDEQALKFEMDRSSIEFDFLLAQKSYAVTINAMSALALNRPGFYRDAILCLSRRAVHSPSMTEEHTGLSSSGVKAVKAQIASSCLTLLRNPLSVSSNSFGLLQKALEAFEMAKQADKALLMARQAHSLKTAGRAARNRANVYYEWDTSGAAETDGGQQHRSSKRQRETDDALAKMRKMRAEKGLGHGIQLPTSMSDAVELIIANLPNLVPTRPKSTSTKSRKVPVSLDFVVDAIMTNGNSLIHEEGRWYERDGGMAWDFDLSSPNHFQPSSKFLETMELVKKDEKEVDSEADKKKRKLYHDQCETAATEALGRIISNSAYGRSKCLADFGNQIAARLAFTLQGSKQAPPTLQKSAYSMARESVSASKVVEKEKQDELVRFVDTFPLAASALALDASIDSEKRTLTETDSSIALRLLNEAILKYEKESLQSADDGESTWVYDRSLDVFVASIVHAGDKANDKPSDAERKKIAAQAALNLQQDIAKLPRLTKSSLMLISRLCDIEDITKKSTEAARKTAPEDIAAGAAAHAAKVAAEKRATAALLILRDVAFQRDLQETRMTAVECAVGIASGRLPASASVQDKALKLVMNVLYTKNDRMAGLVVDAATAEIERASQIAIESYDAIRKANKEVEASDDGAKKNPSAPRSDEEKQVMDRLRKPAVLYMALCVRRPDIINTLFQVSCVEKADALSKTVQANMSKLSRAAAAKHGAASIAMDVAAMTGASETRMLLSFLDNLAPTPDEDLIKTCFKIEESKTDKDGNKDPRYIIPVVSVMKRVDLVERLPEFVKAEDKVFLAAFVRMGDRVGRQALLFREELDEENPSLRGMTLCEQLVYLHKLNFAAAGIPQKRYLNAIKLCLEDDEVYNDRVVMSALDQISGTFLTGAEKLPLAFMRTCILVLSKHDSLHSWISQILLPRLVDGKIYEDARQWEGWMRCAHMLEQSEDQGVRVGDAIAKLPPEQLMQYQNKWAGR